MSLTYQRYRLGVKQDAPSRAPGRSGASRLLFPLRTQRATFTALRSSMTDAPGGTRRCCGLLWCIMFLPMAIGMEQHQVPWLVILVMAIPMMQLDFLFDLDHLPTTRAEPVLLSQELSTKRRRRTERQLPVAVLEVRLPCGIKGIGCAFDLEIALRCDGLLHPEQLFASGRVGKPPPLSLTMGAVAVNDPASGLVRVAALGPAIHPLPDKIVELGEGLATDAMAMRVRPPPEHGTRIKLSSKCQCWLEKINLWPQTRA
jgi:hypothetical protein